MIHKDWNPPIYLRQLQALSRRLPPSYPKLPLIKDQMNTFSAGFKGEEAVKYPLSMLNPDEYHIFHDIRLPVGTHFIQIDILLISTNMIIILEVKNIAGTLYFDHQFHQLIRTLDGKENGFPDPILQMERQGQLLNRWLAELHFPDKLPIVPLLVISNPQTIIKSSNSHYTKMILHRNYLPAKIMQIETLHKEILLTKKDMRKLFKRIKSQNQPYKADILGKFQLSADDLLKGIHCPACHYLPLLRLRSLWKCPACKQTHKDPYNNTLQDYALLLSETITNKELREFMLLPSPAQATRILKRLPKIPTAKRTTYSLFPIL